MIHQLGDKQVPETLEGLPIVNHKKISFEGERGTGKTSVIRIITSVLEQSGIDVAVNRSIDTGKTLDPDHLESIRYHDLWQNEVGISTDGGKLVVNNPEVAEYYAEMKFIHTLEVLRNESVILDRYQNEKDSLLCDRDLDTVVLYAAIERFIANPSKYEDDNSKVALIEALWFEVLDIRELPDITFCLSTNSPQDALSRSYEAKITTAQSFDLSPLQSAMQLLASQLLPGVVEIRQTLHPEKEVVVVNVDGKSQEEVATMILNKLTKTEIRFPFPKNYPILSLRVSPGKNKVEDVAHLAELLHGSAAGAAFPSSMEVAQGFSNCVYSNLSLCEWAEQLGFKNVLFANVVKSGISGTNPIHWVVFEITDITRNTGRIIDITPFNRNPVVTDVFQFTLIDGVFQLIPLTNKPLHYHEIRIDSKHSASSLMELAFLAKTQPDSETVLDRLCDIYISSYREEYKVFSGIRIGRIFEARNNYEQLLVVIEELTNDYPENWILAREVARLVIEKKIVLTASLGDMIKEVRRKINGAVMKMEPDEEKKRLLDYYVWIFNI
jgi:hypothetical protein